MGFKPKTVKRIMATQEKEEHETKRLKTGESPKFESAFSIASEAGIVMAQACELFVQELAERAYHHTQDRGRKTLFKADLLEAVYCHPRYYFLVYMCSNETK